jgi:hypothetical protein
MVGERASKAEEGSFSATGREGMRMPSDFLSGSDSNIDEST